MKIGILSLSQLPFLCGSICLLFIFELTLENKMPDTRWPMPAPYWYHGVLEVDRWILPDLNGRSLQ